MKRYSSHTSLARVEAPSDGLGRGAPRLVGKVVLIEATEPQSGVLRAHRYAKEGADIALTYAEPCDELFTVQRQIEALGSRCVLYELELDDEWNCSLVVQSTLECLGPIDFVVNGHGHVHATESDMPLTASELLSVAIGPSRGPARKPPHAHSPRTRTDSAA